MTNEADDGLPEWERALLTEMFAEQDRVAADVYRKAAEAWWRKVEEVNPMTPLEKLNMEMVFDLEMTFEACVDRLSGDPQFRAAIDVAREQAKREITEAR